MFLGCLYSWAVTRATAEHARTETPTCQAGPREKPSRMTRPDRGLLANTT